MNGLSSLFRARLFAGFVFAAMALPACSDSAERQRSASVPSAPAGSASTAPTSAPDPSAIGNSSASGNAGAGRDDTAKASDDALKPMSKDEEAKTMPRPGQANDHSTLAPKRSEQ